MCHVITHTSVTLTINAGHRSENGKSSGGQNVPTNQFVYEELYICPKQDIYFEINLKA